MEPKWTYIVLAICLVLTISSAVFSFKECGAKALLLGHGAVAAAFMGMCD